MPTRCTTREQAERLAKAIATDVSIYQHQEVAAAKAGPVPENLVAFIREGWDLYASRLDTKAVPDGATIFDAAIRDRVWAGWGGAT